MPVVVFFLLPKFIIETRSLKFYSFSIVSFVFESSFWGHQPYRDQIVERSSFDSLGRIFEGQWFLALAR